MFGLRSNCAIKAQCRISKRLFREIKVSDFAVLFLVCHESRVEADKPRECYLEQWVRAAARNGIRALEQLRFGVEEAIKEIGQGFLEEPANTALLNRLRNDALSGAEYFRQILRLIYRMLFLFAAEDRDLLHPPETDKFTRKLYRKYYSLGRVRDLAAMNTGRALCLRRGWSGGFDLVLGNPPWDRVTRREAGPCFYSAF